MLRRKANLITEIIKEIGLDDGLQKLIDDLKDVLSKTWEKEKRTAIIEALRSLDKVTGPVTAQELQRLEDNLRYYLGTDLAILVRQPVVDITEAAYSLGLRQAAQEAGPLGAGIRWNLPDLQSLDILNRNTLFWVGDYYHSQVQDNFKEVLQEFFKGGYTRDQIAAMLEETFAALGPKTKTYWDLLADHTCTKIREIGRLSGYEQSGIEYLEIRAWLDARTTAICRSLHGRVIPLREVRAFVDNYLAACESGDKEAAKKAWPMWTEKQFRTAALAGTASGRLTASGVGLPPYHFRCRTITVSYLEVLDGKGRNVANRGQEVAFWDGEKEVKQKIAWEYQDKLGRKVTVTNDAKHILQHKDMSEGKIKAALNSIHKVGYSRDNPGELVCLSQNGVVTVFRGNVVYTQFRPPNPTRYFNANTTSRTRVKKWLFERFFTFRQSIQ